MESQEFYGRVSGYFGAKAIQKGFIRSTGVFTCGAEDDAWSLFTPELIAALRRVGRSVDVEVSGSFLFIYSSRRFPFPRPGAVTAVFSLISLVGSLARTT